MTSEILELIFQAKDMASGAISGLRGGMTDLTNAQKTYNTSLESLSGPANEFKNMVMTLGAAVGVAGLAKSFIEVNASAEKTKLMLEGMMGSTEKANAAFQWILDFSTKAPFSIDALKNSFVKLQVAGLDPMSGSLQTLTDALAAVGGSDEDLTSAAIAIQQMAGKGVISMEELRGQLGEKLPTAMKAMADGMGMSMAQLSKAVETGSVTASVGLTAMMGKLEEMYGGRGQSMMMSWTGLISNVKVAWEKFMLTLGETGIFDQLKSTIDGVLKKIDEMTKNGELAVWGQRISTTAMALIDLFLKLSGVFVTVVDALGPFLPAIVEVIAYFKAFQILLGAFVGLPMQVASKLMALGDAFKFVQTTGIYAWFQGLSAILSGNASGISGFGKVLTSVMASTAGQMAVFAVQAAAAGAAAYAGWKIGEMIGQFKLLGTSIQDYVSVGLIKLQGVFAETAIKALETQKTMLEFFGKNTDEVSKRIAALRNEQDAYAGISNDLLGKGVKYFDAYKTAMTGLDKQIADLDAAYKNGTVSSGEYSAKIHDLNLEKTQLTKTSGESASALQHFASAISNTDKEMAEAKKAYEAGTMSAADYQSKVEALTQKKAELVTKLGAVTKGIEDIDKKIIALNASFESGQISEDAYREGIDKLSAAKQQLIGKIDGIAQASEKQKKTYEDFISGLEKGSADWIKIEEKRIATMDANNAYEKALLDKALAEKTISQTDYYAKVQAMDEEAFERKQALIQAQIDLEKSKGSEADFAKIAELEEQKTQLALKGTTDRVKLETDAIKETDKQKEDSLGKSRELQELELQSLKSKLDLADAMDEEAAKRGIITQSELLANKLARAEEFYTASIAKAEEYVAMVEMAEGTDSDTYAKAVAAKTKLQDEWATKAIQSEASIREAQNKEINDAQKFYAQAVGDRVKLAEIERDEKLAKAQQMYDQGLISERQFQDVKQQIIDDANAKIAQGNTKTVSQINFEMGTIADSVMAAYEFARKVSQSFGVTFEYDMGSIISGIKETYASTITTVKNLVSGVSDQFSAIKNSGIDTLSKAYSAMSQIRGAMTGDWMSFYYYMKDLGKNVASEVGLTAEAWVDKLSDYIYYVQGLMQSLKDTTNSYRDQLDQLKGNQSAINDRWYDSERAKLKDKYAGELQETAAYKEAELTLIKLYEEKKKKIAEDDAKAKADGAKTGTGTSPGATGFSVPITQKAMPDWGSMFPTTTTAPAPVPTATAAGGGSGGVFSPQTTFQIIGFDDTSTIRMCKDVIFPEWERYLKGQNLDLSKLRAT